MCAALNGNLHGTVATWRVPTRFEKIPKQGMFGTPRL